MYGEIRYSSPLGTILLASEDDSLIGLWFEGQRYLDRTRPAGLEARGEAPVLREAALWLDDYFAGRRPDPDRLPLAPIGSSFRRLVWRLLREIPYGETTTYGALAKETARRLGRETMSAQAVGGAVAHNPLSILIPCHRVVGADGSLTGYAGGLERKRALLALEGVDPGRFHDPKRRDAG